MPLQKNTKECNLSMVTEIEKATYNKTIGITNNNPLGRGFAHPVDMAIFNDKFYVLNKHPVFARVGVCNYKEDYINEFGTYGHGDGQFWLPTGITSSSTGTILVCDEHHNRVSKFSEDGTYLSNWGKHGSDAGQLNGPSGITVDMEDNVYVVDQYNHRIQKFSLNGDFINTWGEHGKKNSQFDHPWGISVGLDGYIYVTDWGNDRIQKFDTNGSFISVIGGPNKNEGSLNKPAKATADKDGYVYVADWGNESVKIYSPEGGHVQSLRGEATLSKWAQEFLDANPDESTQRDISDLKPDLPKHFNTPYLISTQIETYFWGLSSVVIDNNSKLYVIESSRHRIQIYNI